MPTAAVAFQMDRPSLYKPEGPNWAGAGSRERSGDLLLGKQALSH